MALDKVVDSAKLNGALKATADAIRSKTGSTDSVPFDPSTGFKTTVESMEIGGGGGSVEGAHIVTFMNDDGSTELGSRLVLKGNTCGDPIALGLFATPTKASTAQYNYSFYGWATSENGAADDNALVNITGDKTLYANFANEIRYYTARFYDGDTLMKTESVAYGNTATPPDTTKDGYAFSGWTPSDLTITGDTDFIGEWLSSMAVVLDETSFSYINASVWGSHNYTFDSSITLTNGKTYTVIYDGVEYVCVARNVTSTYPNYNNTGTLEYTFKNALGDPSHITELSDAKFTHPTEEKTGDPFFIWNNKIYATNYSGTHTVKILEHL